MSFCLRQVKQKVLFGVNAKTSNIPNLTSVYTSPSPAVLPSQPAATLPVLLNGAMHNPAQGAPMPCSLCLNSQDFLTSLLIAVPIHHPSSSQSGPATTSSWTSGSTSTSTATCSGFVVALLQSHVTGGLTFHTLSLTRHSHWTAKYVTVVLAPVDSLILILLFVFPSSATAAPRSPHVHLPQQQLW